MGFVNGIEKIRLQLYFALIASIINIPLSIFYAKNIGMDTAEVILATCVCLSLGSIIIPIQYIKIINNKAVGIWNK